MFIYYYVVVIKLKEDCTLKRLLLHRERYTSTTQHYKLFSTGTTRRLVFSINFELYGKKL